MLRLYDARTGRVEEVAPGTRGRLTVYLRAPAAGRRIDAGALRARLVADLVRRAAERHNLRVTGVESLPGDPLAAGTAGAARADADGEGAGEPPPPATAPYMDAAALNIHPPLPHPHPVERVDVVVEAAPCGEQGRAGPDGLPGPAGPPGPEVARHWIRVEPALFVGDGAAAEEGEAAPPGDVTLSGIARRGLDPLALRLALLARPYRERVELTWDDLSAAEQALTGWRARVARWAESPSGVPPKAYVHAVYDAFDDDLDTCAALAALRRLAQDEAVAAGARFEAFAHLDRLLGLDLARDVGKAG